MSVSKNYNLILNGYSFNKNDKETSNRIINIIDSNYNSINQFIITTIQNQYDSIDEYINFIKNHITTYDNTTQSILFDFTYNFIKNIIIYHTNSIYTCKEIINRETHKKHIDYKNNFNITLYNEIIDLDDTDYSIINIDYKSNIIYKNLLEQINKYKLPDTFNLFLFCNNYFLYMNKIYYDNYKKKSQNIDKELKVETRDNIMNILMKDLSLSISQMKTTTFNNKEQFEFIKLISIYLEYSQIYTNNAKYINDIINRFYPDIPNEQNIFTLCKNIQQNIYNTDLNFNFQELKNLQFCQFLLKSINDYNIYYNDPQNVYLYIDDIESNYQILQHNNKYIIQLLHPEDKIQIGRILTNFTYLDKQINTQKILNILINTPTSTINNFIKCDKWYNHLRYLLYLYDYNIYKYGENININYQFEYHEIQTIEQYNQMILLFYPKYKKIFTNLNKLIKSNKSFILTFYKYDDTTNNYIIYKYKINYSLLSEGDLIELCVLRIKHLLEFIYPNLKEFLYENADLSNYIGGTKNIPYINTEMIIKYLLPFINNNSFEDIKKINSLDEIYSTIDENNIYKFTNYNCDHTLSLKDGIHKYKFNLDDFILNANAIFKTIIISENKFFINWNNTFPYVNSVNILKNTNYYKKHTYLPCKNTLFYYTDNLTYKIPYDNKPDKMIHQFIDIEAIEFLTNNNFHILESSIDDLLFLNNTMNEFYNYYNSFVNLPTKWYNILPEEKEHYLKILFRNEIDNSIFDINDNTYYSHINLKIDIDDKKDDFVKYQIHKENINEILQNNVINLFKRGILADIIVQYNNTTDIKQQINNKENYDNFIQKIMYEFENLPNDRSNVNAQNAKYAFKYAIIQLCKESYYFLPSYYCLNNYDELKERRDFKKYTYNQIKDLPYEINIKFIENITEFYNKGHSEKIKYSQLYTYICRVLYKYQDILNILPLKENDIIYNKDIYKFENISDKIMQLPKNDDNILNLCKFIIKQYEIKKYTGKNTSASSYISIVNDYNNYINKLEDILNYAVTNIISPYKEYINKVSDYYNLTDKFYNDNNKYLTQFYWNSFFSMYYLEQINIFNKFLNNRVIFATGSTGTGKSTQLPKLLLFAGIVFENNINYSILCSQPRQKPTADNAIEISKQLSIPLFNEELSENNNIEYFIQYKHGQDNHTSIYSNYPTLTFETDKIVYNNILNNPLCCSYKLLLPQEELIINKQYNIIIVDEAHEHNINMDLILSVMKQYCFYNNEIKLVIISATMDSDEANYRKYYDNINDLITPFNLHILYSNDFLKSRNLNYNYYQLQDINLSNDEQQLLYPVIDKRLDISEPLQTTIYTIKDIYMNLNDEQLKDETYKNKIIKNIILKELQNPITKDFLVFKYGRNPIEKFIKQLLPELPSDVLILPFYSELNDDVKVYIGEITKHRNEINMPRNIDTLLNLKNNTIFTSGKNHYNHYIIVATNIAEASITIDSLNVVIDDGIQNVNVYDNKFNSSQIIKDLIAETNRLQRRGRVGRTSNGTAYFLYKQNYLLNVIPQYKICISNVSSEIIPLISINYNKEFDTLLNDLIICANYYKTNYDYIYMKNKSIFDGNEHFIKTKKEYSDLLHFNLKFLNNVNYDKEIDNTVIKEKVIKEAKKISYYEYSFDKTLNNYTDKSKYGIFYPLNKKNNDTISELDDIKNINLISLTNIIIPSKIKSDDIVYNLLYLLQEFKCKHNLLINRLLNCNNFDLMKFNNKALNDDILKYIILDGINFIIDKFVELYKYDNKIYWQNSFYLNNKYSSYIKLEDYNLIDMYKQFYNKIKIIFTPTLKYDNNTYYLVYNFGLNSDILLNVSYNFFNISYNETNLTRDMFYNVITEHKLLNLSKNIINTYKSLKLIDIDSNNNIFTLNNYNLLYSLSMNVKIQNDNIILYLLGCVLAQIYNCLPIYIQYLSIIINYDKIISKLKLNIKCDDELVYLYNLFYNNKIYDKSIKKLFDNVINKTYNDLYNNLTNYNSESYDIFNELVKIYKNEDLLKLKETISKSDIIDIIFMFIFKNNIIAKLLNESIIMHKGNIFKSINDNKKYTYVHLYINVFYPQNEIFKYISSDSILNDNSLYYIYFYDSIQLLGGVKKLANVKLLHKINPKFLNKIDIDIVRIKNQIQKYNNTNYANTLKTIIYEIENN